MDDDKRVPFSQADDVEVTTTVGPFRVCAVPSNDYFDVPDASDSVMYCKCPWCLEDHARIDEKGWFACDHCFKVFAPHLWQQAIRAQIAEQEDRIVHLKAMIGELPIASREDYETYRYESWELRKESAMWDRIRDKIR